MISKNTISLNSTIWYLMNEIQEERFSIKQFKQRLEDNKISMAFQGILSQDILTLVGQSLRNLPNNQVLAKRLFGLAVEMTQNIHHYSAQKIYSDKDGRDIGMGIVCIGQDEDFHLITSGNYIYEKDAKVVKERSRYINSLSDEELKQYYREQRRAPQRKDKPGANLGFIEMRRKSGNPVYVEVIDVNEEMSFFILSVKISKEHNQNNINN